MGDLRALQGVSKFPVRIKCALLAFDALREALGDDQSAGPSEVRGSNDSSVLRRREAAH